MNKTASEFLRTIEISDFSSTPKYQQLADAVIEGIKNNYLEKEAPLNSINELSTYLDISRDTVEKAYKLLKAKGIITSSPGKGYFVATTDLKRRIRIAFLLNKLSAHKKIVYDAFSQEIVEIASIDLFVYNSDVSYLRSLLTNLTKIYDYYVIFPHFKEGRDRAPEVISKLIPIEKLLVLGKNLPEIQGEYPAVFENYEADIYSALEKALPELSKYHSLKLIFPDHSDYPKAIIKGFYKFCQQYAFDHLLVSELEKEKIENGTCYINLEEADLVKLLDKVIQTKQSIGKEVGIISYNETPLKKFILDGITTISTDFEFMGKTAAQLIKENSKQHIEAPFYLTLRSSI
ncbi:GntR family transcriptional regulator [Sphingobacterium yanglingense]|uniref:Regulatory GntR family protein n=1 Tax=Sphingobacterium yanglingense TaxID=1437280 RepID=A0A4R6WMA6_9SPHI|nr:winged helix-turn-helix domain-containing protein [Sphingobacterium yanglingense]TDQ80157.1 regulatory GntR family protein [Sphingobacterium yanglingense]